MKISFSQKILVGLLVVSPNLVLAQGLEVYELKSEEYGKIDVSECPSTTLRVDNIANAKGYGSHFSLAPYENGHGGANFECHLTPQKGNRLFAYCVDGVLGGAGTNNSTNRTNRFKVDLGPRKLIDSVEWKLGENGVGLTVQKRATGSYTGAARRIPYQITSYFPMHPDIGPCGKDNFNSNDTLYWVANGVLNGQSNRSGSGYQMTITNP